MRLILASQGFTTDEIEREVAEIVGKPAKEINIAIINESVYEIDKNKSKRWLINELSNIEKHIGGKIDFVNFHVQSKEEIRERLMNADLTYIVGGKQHVYSKIFNETDTIDLIKEVANKRVIMGTSAGSIVLGKQIQSEKFWKERYNLKLEDFEYQELGIVPFNIIPHFLREDHKKWTKDFLKDTLSDNPFTVYAITDEQAIAYIDGKVKFIGGEPEVFRKKIEESYFRREFMEEYIDLVNEKDEVVGKEERAIVNKSGTKNFRTVNVFFVNSKGEILVQHRSNNRRLFPGMWDFSAAGHIKHGEDYKEAAIRETEEELGVNVDLKEVAHLSPYELNISSFKKIFVAHYDGEFKYDTDGIASIFYINKEEIKQLLDRKENKFLSDYKEVFTYLYDHNLF